MEVFRIYCTYGDAVDESVRTWHEADNSGTRRKYGNIGDDGVRMVA